MTRERDRIQENANKYIVCNCPAISRKTKVCDAYETTRDLPQLCKDCTDCVIKQVITICKWYKMSKEDMKRSKEFADIIRGSKYGSDALAIQILQLFDIEEISK